jgi:hypothetical protein
VACRPRIDGFDIGLLGVYACVSIGFVLFGRVNADEGLYFTAWQRIFEDGLRLYRDFPFGQGSGVLFYGWVQSLFGSVLGSTLLSGRLTSFVAGLIGTGAMLWFARRTAGRAAALITLGLLLPNIVAMWSVNTIRTEALATPLVVLATISLFTAQRSVLGWALAPSLLVWATAVRLTNGFALLGVIAWVAYSLRGSLPQLGRVAAVVALNGLVAALPMLLELQAMLFHVFDMQSGRVARLGGGAGIRTASGWMRGKLMFILEPGASYGPLLLLTALAGGLGLRSRHMRAREDDSRGAPTADPVEVFGVTLGIAVLVMLPQLAMQPTFAAYFVTASVLLALGVGVALSEAAGRDRLGLFVVTAALGAAAVYWSFALVRDYNVYLWPGRPGLLRFAELRQDLRALAPDHCRVLTSRPYFGTETGCRLVGGLEYSIFSFFPDLPDEEARSHSVLNRNLLNRTIREDPPEFAVLVPADIRLIDGRRVPEGRVPMLRAMGNRYVVLRHFELPTGPAIFGGGTTRFSVLVRRDLAPASITGSSPTK